MNAGDALSSPLIDQLLRRCSFPPAGTVVECAVSGGADSMALLVLAVAAGLDVTAVHVDHGLRAGSSAEAGVVEAAALRLGASFEARTVAVADGPNLEARAREARYAALAPDVLTGHTLDDQAETVLLFLMRGTGPEGFAGMGGDGRPLLALRRSETVALCRELGLDTFDDPSNADPRFTRNRVRSELLPLMDDIAQRDVAPLLARAAGLQQGLLDVVATSSAAIDPTDARAIAAAPPAVARESLRRWWREETRNAYAPDAAAIERMLAVAAGSATAADLVGGWRIARTDQRLRLERSSGT